MSSHLVNTDANLIWVASVALVYPHLNIILSRQKDSLLRKFFCFKWLFGFD